MDTPRSWLVDDGHWARVETEVSKSCDRLQEIASCLDLPRKQNDPTPLLPATHLIVAEAAENARDLLSKMGIA